jgi:succinate dehydrogenase / fumarate reductase membrane anchor subunit
VVSVALLLYVVSVMMHAWIGVRDVLIDYVHPIAIRATLLGVVALSLVAMGLWAAQALILARLA